MVASSSQPQSKKRLPGEEDDCPICYENMHRADEKTLTFCEECGNGLHKECFQQCRAFCGFSSTRQILTDVPIRRGSDCEKRRDMCFLPCEMGRRHRGWGCGSERRYDL